MLTTKQKVDKLERIFGQYMTQTNAMIAHLNEMMEDMKQQAVQDRQQAEHNRRQDRQEWNERFEQDRKEWNKRWGELANKLGTIPKDIVAPNLPRIAKEYFQCQEIDDLMVRRWVRNKKDRSKRREFDVILVAGDTVIINETKATVKIEYINQFLAVLPELTDYFPEYQGKTIIPTFASLYLQDDIIDYLTKHHIYAMMMGDETMQIVNFQELNA